MASWNYALNEGLDPASLVISSNDMAWWDCEMHGPYQARVRNRAIKGKGTGCQTCAFEAMRQSKITPTEGKSLQEVAPEVSLSWHPALNGEVTPSDISAGSGLKFWWLCHEHGPWQATPHNRAIRGHGCDRCSRIAIGRKKATPGPGQSLAARRPDLAAQWHPTLNLDLTPDDVKPGSRKMAWWDCPEHGPWEQSLNVRFSQGCGCPDCGKQKARGHRRAVLEEQPALALA